MAEVAAAVKVIKALGIQLKANPYDYNAHITYIKALREHGEKGGGVGGQQALEHAREHLRSVYPLSEKLWEEWINDAEVVQRDSTAHSGEQRTDKISSLYRSAFKDYLSIKLLLKYCKYMSLKVNMTCTSVGEGENAHNAANIAAISDARGAYELSLAYGGLHGSQGVQLWKSYVEFETAICDMIEELEGDESGEEDGTGAQGVTKEQQDKVAEVYRRALAIPMQGLEEIRDMQAEWCDDNERLGDVSATESAYTRALELREPLDVFERSLQSALSQEASKTDQIQHKPTEPASSESAESSVAVYQRLVQHEIDSGDDPARVMCVYERSIADHPLNVELWMAYTAYVEKNLPTSSVYLDLCERSTRNCAWSSFLWQRRMRALERKSEPFHVIEGVFQGALLSGFPTSDEYVQLWLAFIDYQRRRIDWEALHTECAAAHDDDVRDTLRDETAYTLRETCRKASEYITTHFGKSAGDPYAQLPLCWARLELYAVGSLKHARTLLEAAVKDYPKNANVWSEYARFEIDHSALPARIPKVRKIYQTATEKTTGDYAVCQTWVQFERENGTLETYDAACARTQKAMELARTRQAKLEEKERTKAQQQQERAETAQRAKAKKLAEEPKAKDTKPVYTHGDVFADTEGADAGERGKKRTLSGTAGVAQPESDPKRRKTDTQEANSSSEQAQARVGTTVFLSNLSYHTTEQDIQSLFDPDTAASGTSTIKQVRIVKDKATGTSKGYAYLDFHSTSDAEQALLLDRTQKLHNRTVFVSVMNAPKYLPTVDATVTHVHGPTGHVGDGPRAAMTLFCKGLPPNSNIKSVSEIFAKYGEIVSCRLGKGHDGKFKGFAFVEFKTEAEAKRALDALHDTNNTDSTLYVALSSDKSGTKKSKGTTTNTPTDVSPSESANGPVKSVKRLVPRMIKRGGKTPAPRIRPIKAKTKKPGAPTAPKTAEEFVPSVSSVSGLSNADFKSMLTKK